MGKKVKIVGAAAVLSMLAVAGCGPTATSGGNNSTGNSTSSTASTAQTKGFTVALSNSFIGNNWRVQMEKDIQDKIDQYKQSGLVKDYMVTNAGNNVATQISQIQDIIQKHPDLLLVDAASSDALNPVLQKAEQAGITVVAFDNVVTDPQATNVTVDFSSYGTQAAEWLVKTLNGKGNVVALRGVAGTPVDAQIYDAAQKVFSQYPNIKVVKQIYANWDEASAQSQMSSFLATGQKVDAVFTEGGEAYGVAQALVNAKHPLIPIVGGGTVSFLQFWDQHKTDAGFKAISIGNPPALGSYALDVGLMKLQKEQVPNKVVMPLPVVTEQNLSQYLNQPAANRFDVPMTYDQIMAIVSKQQ